MGCNTIFSSATASYHCYSIQKPDPFLSNATQNLQSQWLGITKLPLKNSNIRPCLPKTRPVYANVTFSLPTGWVNLWFNCWMNLGIRVFFCFVVSGIQRGLIQLIKFPSECFWMNLGLIWIRNELNWIELCFRWSLKGIKSFAMGELEARKLKFANTGTEAILMGILVEGLCIALHCNN